MARASALQAGAHAGRAGLPGGAAGARARGRRYVPAGLRHGHNCCDTAPVRAVRAAMHGLGAAWAQDGRAGWVSWAKLVHCAPGSVLTQVLDPV